jgi:EipB-like
MPRHLVAALGLLAVLATSGAAAAGPVPLLSHRAAYRLSLADSGAKAEANSGTTLESVRGALVLEWKADCSGWLSQQRLGFIGTTSEGPGFSYDVRFTSWEAPDDTKLRFQVRSFDDGKATESISGAASLKAAGGEGSAEYAEPDAKHVDLPAGTLFPTQHMQSLIQAGRAGERIVTNYVFDGSGPDALNKVTAVLGQGHTAKAEDGVDEQRWPVSLAYYGVGKADELPEFSIAFELSERGVLHDITLDYGDFALKGELEKLEPLGEPQCQ